MNKNILIVLAGGFLVAILVAVLVQATLGGKKSEVVDVTRVEILVAAKNLSVGKEIRSGDFKWQKWPEDTVFPGAIIRADKERPTEVAKGKLLRPLVVGQPLHMTLLSEDDEGDFLSANVRKGMRAVSLSVKSYVIADRLINPGDFVDILVTYRVRVNSRKNPEAKALVNRYASETVIENIRILAIDKNDTKAVNDGASGGKKKKKKKKRSKKATVTLEVTPDQAEKLVLARKMGSISFALRGIGDNGDIGTDRMSTDVGISRVMTKLTKMSGSSSAVRIYSGDAVREVRARSVQPQEGVDFQVEDAPVPSQTFVIDGSALRGVDDE